MATALQNAQASVAELVQLVPITVAKIAELRVGAQPSPDVAAVQALADAINTQVIAPLAAATADPPPAS